MHGPAVLANTSLNIAGRPIVNTPRDAVELLCSTHVDLLAIGPFLALEELDVTARYWVVGPIAWDSVLQVPELPPRGGFTQATAVVCRPGGAGANVAVGLASAGVPVLMVGYVGRDTADMTAREPADRGRGHAPRSHGRRSLLAGLILVEPSGERTMVGLSPDEPPRYRCRLEPWNPGTWLTLAGWRRCSHRSFVGF